MFIQCILPPSSSFIFLQSPRLHSLKISLSHSRPSVLWTTKFSQGPLCDYRLRSPPLNRCTHWWRTTECNHSPFPRVGCNPSTIYTSDCWHSCVLMSSQSCAGPGQVTATAVTFWLQWLLCPQDGFLQLFSLGLSWNISSPGSLCVFPYSEELPSLVPADFLFVLHLWCVASFIIGLQPLLLVGNQEDWQKLVYF